MNTSWAPPCLSAADFTNICRLLLVTDSAIQQLNRVIQHNAGSAEEMASTAEELAAQAGQLQNLVSFCMFGILPKPPVQLEITNIS
jgi:hypothetical protein